MLLEGECMKTVINNHSQPLPLESGVIVAAAGTNGSVREVESLSDGDLRYVGRGWLVVKDTESSAENEKAIQARAEASARKEKA
jgi:hypothetical protein